MAARFRIGIDLGGTKIEGAAVDGSGAVLVRRRVATPRGNYRATIAAMVALVGEIAPGMPVPTLAVPPIAISISPTRATIASNVA